MNLGQCCQLHLLADIKVQASKNYEQCKHRYNYVILTKRVKVQQEKKPASNSKCMQSVVFEQTFTKQFLKRRKNVAEIISVTINDSSDLLCFELYLINIFVKSAKGRELRRCYLQSDTSLFISYC